MRQTAITKRLAGLGGAKWEVYLKAKEMVQQGQDVIETTIGNRMCPRLTHLLTTAIDTMQRAKTTYSDGRGEAGLR